MKACINSLATLPETEASVLSGYFDLTQPIDRLGSAFNLWCLGARATLRGLAKKNFEAARVQIDKALRVHRPDSVQGLAVFARTGGFPIHLVLPFGATLENHFQLGPVPAIFPLVQLRDRFHRFVVVISGEEHARIFEVILGAVSEQIQANRPDLSHRVGREWTREHFHQCARENDRQFLRDQVTIIGSLMSRRGYNHLILAGHPRCVKSLKAAMPRELADLVVETIARAPNGHDCSEILEQAIATFIEVEQAESRGTVERLHEQVRRGGLAVVGIQPTREAMLAGAVSELVVSEELPVPDREDMVRIATTRGLLIEVCEKDDLLNKHGGVGALLRYRLEHSAVIVRESARA